MRKIQAMSFDHIRFAFGKPRFETAFVLALLALSSVLFLKNLSNHTLWQDEAQTALISKTILERGLPYGTDGLNSFSQELGTDHGPNHLWKWHPWLPFYFVAASYKLFGINTLSARLPFALVGIATVLLLYQVVADLWKDKKTAMTAAILLALCIPFLLLSRQCRYYSMTSFFSLLGLYTYFRLLESRRFSRTAFVATGVLLFHTHYFYCATLLATTALHSLLTRRDRFPAVLAAGTWTVVLCLPGLYWYSGTDYNAHYGHVAFKLASTFRHFFAFSREILLFTFPPFLLTIPLLIAIDRIRRKLPVLSAPPASWRATLFPALFIIVNLPILSFTVLAPFFRYLAPIIPMLMILAALLIRAAWRLHPALGALALLACLAYQALPDYLYEITHDYDGPLEKIVTYLNSQPSNPGDVVAITYGDLPLKFYTGLRVVGGLTGEDLAPARDARWIIFRKRITSTQSQRVEDYLIGNRGSQPYRLVTLDAVDIPYENRESPTEHHYRTVKEGPRVQILERIDRLPTQNNNVKQRVDIP